MDNLGPNALWILKSVTPWWLDMVTQNNVTLWGLVPDFSFLFVQLDCRGVRAIASSANVSSIYTAGVDGMVCVIDFMTGNLLEKFKASTKPVSCMSVSPGIYPSQLLYKSSCFGGRRRNHSELDICVWCVV